MANLVSPGVQVTISDESVYGPAGAGTVPMLFIATGADKVVGYLQLVLVKRKIKRILLTKAPRI